MTEQPPRRPSQYRAEPAGRRSRKSRPYCVARPPTQTWTEYISGDSCWGCNQWLAAPKVDARFGEVGVASTWPKTQAQADAQRVGPLGGHAPHAPDYGKWG